MFSTSDAYDRFMGRWSCLLASVFVQYAAVRDSETILDVGSGTGSLAAAIASVAPSAQVTGIDSSASYVDAARTRCAGSRASFDVGDAQRLRFASGSFDRTFSLLALNFVREPAKALDEMVRVTRCGGTVAAAIWDYGSGMEMLRVFWNEAIAQDPAADACDERHMPLCRFGELGALWRERGLEALQEDALTIETVFSSFDDYWSSFLEGQGPAGAYAVALRPDRRAELRDRLRRRLLGDGADRPIVLRARAWAVRGTVAFRHGRAGCVRQVEPFRRVARPGRRVSGDFEGCV